MTNELAVQNFSVLRQQAGAMAASGFFADARSEAQAVVKIMAGSELGLGPFASMSGIHIIKGKPALGANLIATLIKNDARYNYRVIKHDATTCVIDFYENGEKCGTSEFTAKEAAAAGTQNMNKFPKNMLFARAISNGAKWYTPGIFGGAPVYTPDELGASVNEVGDFIVDAEDFVIEQPQEQQQTRKVSAAMRKRFHALGVEKFGDDWDNARAALVGDATNGRTNSSKDVTYDEMLKMAEELKA